MPAAVSWLAAAAGAAACAGAGAVVVRAPAEAQPARSTSNAKLVDRYRMCVLLLFHEFEHDRRARRRDAHESPWRLLGHVHDDWQLHPAQLEPIRREIARGHHDVLDASDL